MLQLHNHTRFAASLALFPDEQGVDTLYIIVKASFTIGKEFSLADEQAPPQDADQYWTEAGKSSLRYASDMHIGKPSSDIVMLGHACAPSQQEVPELDVGLSVGEIQKSVRVFGDRRWNNGRITVPQPFKTMPMVYEKAYGGVHWINGEVDSAEERNPVGCGFSGRRSDDEMNGMPLPNIEDPAQLIRTPSDRPRPACFGFCAPNWQPRVSYAGTYDDTWRKTRAPYLPADFDKRFLNMAHPDLVYSSYLQGGEPVTINGMHPKGPMQFDLPRLKFVSRVRVGRNIEVPSFDLETLILEPNQAKLSMVWRAALPCDKQALKVSEVTIALSR